MRGEIVQMVVLDVGAEVDLSRITRLFDETPQPSRLLSRAPRPRYAGFTPPVQIEIDPAMLGEAPTGMRIQVRLHQVGAVAVRIRIPCVVGDVAELAAFPASQSVGGLPLDEAVLRLARRVAEEISHAKRDPYGATAEPEEYRVFCLVEGAPTPSVLLAERRRLVTALILGEDDPDRLDDSLVQSVLRHTVRYYKEDLIVVGWENALLISPRDSYEDALGVMELANLELLELRTYDSLLDTRLTRAFDELEKLWGPRGLFRSARQALSDISELRVDFARLTDNLHDTGKMFGDWYLAKVHEKLRDRFHVADWEKAVAAKMDTLEDMFHLAGEETNHRRALVLETMIVLLFVLDLIVLFGIGK